MALASVIPLLLNQPIDEPTPYAADASIMRSLNLPSSYVSCSTCPCSPAITSTIPTDAPARCEAKPSTLDKTRSVSLLRITMNSQGCLLLALPDQRATSSTAFTISCDIGSGRNWRMARSRFRKFIRFWAFSGSDKIYFLLPEYMYCDD